MVGVSTLWFTSVKVAAGNCWDELLLPEPGGGRKTPVPGTGMRGGGCLGGAAVHPVEPGGIGTGAGNDMGGTTGAVTNSGCIPFGAGIVALMGGAGSTPVVGTVP